MIPSLSKCVNNILKEKMVKKWLLIPHVWIQRGERGSGPPPPPPRKSQVKCVSIEISIWTPPPPPPPPPHRKKLDPSGSLEKYSFLCNITSGPLL